MRGLVRVFIFMITVTVGGPSAVWAQGSEEAADWEEARCGYPEEMRRFIKKYPDSEYRVEAEGCLEKARDKQLSPLLSECAAHLEADRLTVGAGGNAFDCYREVLALDSGNEVALSGFREIEDRYIGWVRRDMESGEWARAGRFLEKVRGLNPEREEVLELERLLKEAEAERKRKEAEAAEAAERERQVGREFRDCAGCPEMVVVPSGSFRMGSPSSESGRDDNEGPRHRVSISQSFAVGKYEVTFAEWDACVSDGGCGGYQPDDEGWGRGGRPVIGVSWQDAKEYTGWLSAKTGYDYRLLSESEWEYVARAGTETEFHTGRRITTDQANFDGRYTYNGSSEGVYRRETVSVGSFPGNDFGLHDVHGNVWEWVEDCWNGSYDGAPTDGSAWISGECQYRVLRGGSWNL